MGKIKKEEANNKEIAIKIIDELVQHLNCLQEAVAVIQIRI